MKRILCIIMIIILLIPHQVFAFNEQELEYCNINQWQKYGYTGKGVKIVVSDSVNLYNNLEFINLINIATTTREVADGQKARISSTHSQLVVQVIQLIAPNSTIYISNSLTNAITLAINNDAQIITRSLSSTTKSFTNKINELSKQAYNKGVFMNGSAGNKVFNEYAPNPYWFSTGAIRLQNNEIYKEEYSCYGEGLDFMGFARLEVYEDKDGDGKGDVMSFAGTSASAPWVSGMTALYYQYYKDINGVFPTVLEVEKFIQDNCEDMNKEGYDIFTGHGLFILPNLDELRLED